MMKVVKFSAYLTAKILTFFVVSVTFLATASSAHAANYYVDNQSGNDSSAGTSEAQAWKTLGKLHGTNFQPGDVIQFKRGSSWDGPLIINDSGTSEAPIRYTAYGSGAKPVFTGRGGNEYKRAVEVLASWIIVENFRIEDAQDGGLEIFEGNKSTQTPFDHNVVRNVDFYNVGIGVTIKSNYNTVESCTFDNLKMVRNTETPHEDDYGAIAVNLNGGAARSNLNRNSLTGNVITKNTVKNAKAPSHDYDEDGGFVEIFEDVDDTTISYNWVEDSKGFIEIGGTQHSAVVENLKIHHNISLNNTLFSFVNTGTYGIGVKNFQVLNNVIYEAVGDKKTSFWFDGNAEIGPEQFVLKNNIIYNRATVSNKNTFLHQNNIFYRLDRQANQSNTTQADIGFALDSTEKNVDAQFTDAPAKNFTVKATSPAINAGQNLGLTPDYAGTAVPQGGSVDIGIYEYVGAVPSPSPSPSPSVSPSPASCAEDINLDGIVNVFDYSLLSLNFFDDAPDPARADINSDGKVDVFDFSLLSTKLMKRCDE